MIRLASCPVKARAATANLQRGLVDLDRELRSSQSVEVTVRFVSAGEVTVQAAVAAEGRTPSPSVDFSGPAEGPTGS